MEVVPKKRRGRPKGVKNKPKTNTSIKVKKESVKIPDEIFQELKLPEIPIGSTVIINNQLWYSDNRDKNGNICGQVEWFTTEMEKFLNKKTKIHSAFLVDGQTLYTLKCDPSKRYLFEADWFMVEENK